MSVRLWEAESGGGRVLTHSVSVRCVLWAYSFIPTSVSLTISLGGASHSISVSATFHHPDLMFYDRSTRTLLSLLPQPLAAGLLLPVSVNLPFLSTSWKWNHTVSVLS